MGLPSESLADPRQQRIHRLRASQGRGVDDALGRCFIDRSALGQHARDGFPRILGVEQGTLLVPGNALEENLLTGSEQDDEADLPQEFAVFLPKNRAAAGGNDAAIQVRQRLKNTLLYFAKVIFTLKREDRRDIKAGALHHERIGIDELKP